MDIIDFKNNTKQNVITYVQNSKEFLKELEEKAPSYLTKDEDGNITGWIMFHTPVVKNESGSLALSMLTGDEVEFIKYSLTSIVILGTYEEMFADTIAHNTYKLVYPYHIPVKYTDEDGVEREYYRPQKIGVFA